MHTTQHHDQSTLRGSKRGRMPERDEKITPTPPPPEMIEIIVNDLYNNRPKRKNKTIMKKALIYPLIALGFLFSWPAFTPVGKTPNYIKWPVYCVNWYAIWLFIATSPLYESLYFWQTNHYPMWLVTLNNEVNSLFFMF